MIVEVANRGLAEISRACRQRAHGAEIREPTLQSAEARKVRVHPIAVDLGQLGATLLASPVHGELDPKDLVAWVLEDRLAVRVQVQIHKYIWGAKAVGV